MWSNCAIVIWNSESTPADTAMSAYLHWCGYWRHVEVKSMRWKTWMKSSSKITLIQLFRQSVDRWYTSGCIKFRRFAFCTLSKRLKNYRFSVLKVSNTVILIASECLEMWTRDKKSVRTGCGKKHFIFGSYLEACAFGRN